MTLSSSPLSTHVWCIYFDSSISHLKNALQQISSWMIANLLTLNSSKTKFLLIGTKNQLAKIHNSSLFTSTLSRHTFFFYSHSYSSTKSVLFENHQSLFSVRCTLSLEWTSHGTTLASSHTVFPTFTFCCTWQFITTTFSTITTICHYFSLSFRT